MTLPVIPVSQQLPGEIAIPAPGEKANSAGLRGFVQPIVNAIKYCNDLVRIFLQIGGVVDMPGSVSLQSAPGAQLMLNGLTLNDAGAGGAFAHLQGDLVADGLIIGALLPQSGAVSGTTSYTPGSLVYWDGVFSMGAGTIWKMYDGPDGSWIRFVNDNPQSVIVQNPSGAGIDTLGGAPGSKIADTYVKISGVWKRGLQPSYH